MSLSPFLYRLNVGICLFNKDKKIFAGKRVGMTDQEKCWQMPQGGVDSLDDYEILLNGMYIELYEEIGLKKEHVEVLKISSKVRYEFPKEVLEKNKAKFGDFIGQEQKWFYLNFLGQDCDINLNADAKPEFCEWKWTDCEFLVNNVIEMKKMLYKTILT